MYPRAASRLKVEMSMARQGGSGSLKRNPSSEKMRWEGPGDLVIFADRGDGGALLVKFIPRITSMVEAPRSVKIACFMP